MDPNPPFSHATSSAAYAHAHRSTPTSTSPPSGTLKRPSPPGPAERSHTRLADITTPTSRTTPDRQRDISSDPSSSASSSRHHHPHTSPTHRDTAHWHPAALSPTSHPYAAQAQAHPHTHPAAWGAPPPRSDSGLGSASATASDPSRRSLPLHDPSSAPSPMSTVNYGVPAQYGHLGIDDAPLQNSSMSALPTYPHDVAGDVQQTSALLNTAGYQIDQSYRQAMQHHPSVTQAYDFTQPDTYGSSVLRTSSPMPIQQQGYGDEYRLAGAYDVPRTHAVDALSRPLAPTSLASNPSTYTAAAYQRSTNSYDGAMYTHQMPPGPPLAAPIPASNIGYGQSMYGASSLSSMPRSMSSVSADSVRGASQKPKPQCWEHGCNGRKFSTFSNLLRHQREKSGTATKSYCPRCGAEFTRTTARNGHLAHDKCSKQRKSSSEGRT